MHGFLVGSLRKEHGRMHFDEMSKAPHDGSIQAKLHVTDGIENGLEGLWVSCRAGF